MKTMASILQPSSLLNSFKNYWLNFLFLPEIGNEKIITQYVSMIIDQLSDGDFITGGRAQYCTWHSSKCIMICYVLFNVMDGMVPDMPDILLLSLHLMELKSVFHEAPHSCTSYVLSMQSGKFELDFAIFIVWRF